MTEEETSESDDDEEQPDYQEALAWMMRVIAVARLVIAVIDIAQKH